MRPESIRHALDVASNAVWGPWMLGILLGTGVFLTIRLRGVFGRIRFITQEMLVDEAAGKVVLQWRCPA